MPAIYRPGQRIDHYEIIHLLGQGGASRVYLAQDTHTPQEVVLKFPTDELIGGAEVFKRYRREAQIGKRLTHPSIQRHFNQDEDRQEEYLVLEYLRGRTLRAMMKAYEQGTGKLTRLLPTAEVLCIVRQVCKALIYAHEQGVIHSDIKPENIMVLDNGEVKIIDFGIALLKEQRRFPWRSLSSPIGTPDYMAPERLLGELGSIQSDVYAVGVVLYELLCGRTPFEEHDGFSFVTEHFSHDAPGILEFNPTLSPALATVVMRAIRHDPGRRYACMQDLLHDLDHLNDVTPIDYIPDPPKIGGRYRQAIAITLVVLITCLSIVGFGIFAQYAHTLAR